MIECVDMKENKSKERPRIDADVLNKFRAYLLSVKEKKERENSQFGEDR